MGVSRALLFATWTHVLAFGLGVVVSYLSLSRHNAASPALRCKCESGRSPKVVNTATTATVWSTRTDLGANPGVGTSVAVDVAALNAAALPVNFPYHHHGHPRPLPSNVSVSDSRKIRLSGVQLSAATITGAVELWRESFDPMDTANWAEADGSVGVDCSSHSGSAYHFSVATGNRSLVTRSLDMRAKAVTVQGYLRLGTAVAGTCDRVEAGEDVVLQYSVDAQHNTFTTVHTFAAGTRWQCASLQFFNVTLPSSALTNDTRIRWHQPTHGSSTEDAWAVDSLSILAWGSTHTVLAESFDPFNSSNWALSTGTAGTQCSSHQGSALFFETTGDRTLVTRSLNLQYLAVAVSGYLRVGSSSRGSCERMESSDTVRLEYSVDTAHAVFATLASFSSGSVWQCGSMVPFTVVLPRAALTNDTQLRWHQASFSKSQVGFDAWGVDSIQVTAIESPSDSASTPAPIATQYAPVLLLSETFDPFQSSKWAAATGYVTKTCSFDEGNAYAFATSGSRWLLSLPLDFSFASAVTVSGYLVLGTGTTSTCDRVETGEDVVLQYSLSSSSSFNTIFTFAVGGPYMCQHMVPFNVSLPAEARVSGVQLRWYQPNHGSFRFDSWAVDSLAVHAWGSAATVFSDSFDPVVDSNWASATGTAGTTCSAHTGNALQFLHGGNRTLETKSLNLASSAASVSGYLRLGTGFANGSCTHLDDGHDVLLQYSTDAAHTVYTTLMAFDAGSEWQCGGMVPFEVPLPAAARTPDTRIRWTQQSPQDGTNNAWGVDSVCITALGSVLVTPAPSTSPTQSPTSAPTAVPTPSPSASPTVPQPTGSPTTQPSVAPSQSPTSTPTAAPTVAAPVGPTAAPTAFPSNSPSLAPTMAPSAPPSESSFVRVTVLSENFEAPAGLNWTRATGQRGTVCSAHTGAAMYFTSNTERALVTRSLNLRAARVTVTGFLRLGIGTVCASVETGDDVLLQYSTDPAHQNFTTVFSFVAGSPWQCHSMLPFNISLPPDALTNDTRIRWIQPVFAIDNDFWGVDSVAVHVWVTPKYVLQEDFDPINHTNWVEEIGGEVGTNCSAHVGQAFFFNQAGPRWLVSHPLNLAGSMVLVSGYLRLGTGDSCGGLRSNDYSVALQYSVDAAHVQYTSALVFAKESEWLCTRMMPFSTTLPAAARTANTTLRWFQPSHDDLAHWGVDSLSVAVLDAPVQRSLNATVVPQFTILSEQFDPINPKAWQEASGTVGTLCGSRSGQAMYFDDVYRSLVSGVLNLEARSARVTGYLRMGNEGGANSCERISPTGSQDVYLQYGIVAKGNVHGFTTFTTVYRFSTALYASCQFVHFDIAIPSTALKSDVLLRWYQPTHGTVGSDVWAVDNITVEVTDPVFVTYFNQPTASPTPQPTGNSTLPSPTPAPTALPQGAVQVLTEDFDPITLSNWALVAGGLSGSRCSVHVGNGFYFSDAGVRSLVTKSLKLHGAARVDVSGFLRLGNSALRHSCERTEAADTVSLQFSTDSAHTVYSTAFNFTDGSLWQRCSMAWFNVSLPTSALRNGTRLRLYQAVHSSAGFDEWGVDTLSVVAHYPPPESAVLKLNQNYETVMATPASRKAFETALLQDLAATLNTSPEQFRVSRLRAGSVIVELEILSVSNESVPFVQSPAMLLQSLSAAVSNVSSPLYSPTRNITSTLDAAFAVTATPFPTTSPTASPTPAPSCLNMSALTTVLSNFYRVMGGGVTWNIANWLNPVISVCRWPGVFCVGNAIRSLRLDATNSAGALCGMHGALHAALEALTPLRCLQSVTFSQCPHLSGTVPSSALAQLSELQELQLHGIPQMEGTMPRVPARLTTLSVIGGGQLSGTLPADWLRASTTLASLSLEDLPKLSGVLHSDIFANTTKLLTHLRLVALPKVGGEFPASIAGLPALQTLFMSNNALLSGSIPPRFESAATLSSFTVATHPRLEGSLHPTLFEGSRTLSRIVIHTNRRLSGTLPPTIFVPELQHLAMHSMRSLSGQLWPTVANCSQLKFLIMHANPAITGTIPSELSSVPTLRTLDLSSLTRVSGTLPDTFFSKLVNLAILRISSIPLLSGTLPSVYPVLPHLGSFVISSTAISGTLPSLDSKFGKLDVVALSVSFNRLTGTVPSSWCGLSQVRSLDLSFNTGLTGAILPDGCGSFDFRSLETIDARHNNFDQLGSAARGRVLKQLLISHNNFSFATLRGDCPLSRTLSQVDLSHNPLNTTLVGFFSGCVDCTDCGSVELDVSYCGLSGDFTGLNLLGGVDSVNLDGNPISTSAGLSFLSSKLQHVSMAEITQLHGGTSFYFTPQLQTLDVAGVLPQDALCDALVSAPSGMKSLNFSGNVFDTLPCATPMGFSSVVRSGAKVANLTNGLLCSGWTYGPAAEMSTDSDYMHYRACDCSAANQFWGPPAGGSIASSSKDQWTCLACPSHAHCDRSTVPQHCFKGNFYPIFPPVNISAIADSRYTCVEAALQRVVNAKPLRCRVPGVCNAGEQSCVEQQALWAAQRNAKLTTRGEDHAAPQSLDMCQLQTSASSSKDTRWQLFPGYSCARGHDPQSLMCSKCVDGYYRNGDLCHECRDSFSWLVPTAWCVVAAAFLWFVVMYKENLAVGDSAAVAVIEGLKWVQLARVVTSGNSNAADTTTQGQDEELSFAGKIMQDILSFRLSAAECVWPGWEWTDTTWLVLTSPLAVCSVVACCVVVVRQCTTQPTGCVEHIVLAVISSLSFMYIPVLQATLQTLHCDQEPGVPHSFVSSAPWVSCETSTFQGVWSAALVSLVTFCVGFPLLTLHRLQQYHDGLNSLGVDLNSLRAQQALADNSCWTMHPTSSWRMFTTNFRSQLWWWHGVSIGFNIAVVVFSTSLPYNSSYLPVLVFLALLLNLLLQVVYHPYARRKCNWLATLLMITLVSIYLNSVLQEAGEASGRFQGGTAVLTTILYIVSVLAVFLALAYNPLLRVLQRTSVPSRWPHVWKALHEFDRAHGEEQEEEHPVEDPETAVKSPGRAKVGSTAAAEYSVSSNSSSPTASAMRSIQLFPSSDGMPTRTSSSSRVVEMTPRRVRTLQNNNPKKNAWVHECLRELDGTDP